MCALVDLAQGLDRDVRVDLGRDEVRLPEFDRPEEPGEGKWNGFPLAQDQPKTKYHGQDFDERKAAAFSVCRTHKAFSF